MKNIALAAPFATALAAVVAGGALAQDVVRLGTEGAYPPYNFINDANQVDGFERELGDEICARANLTCEWVTTDWDSIIPNLTSGNFDVIMAGMTITEERRAVVAFSEDYYPPVDSAYAALSEGVDVIGGVVSAQAATIQAAHVAETGAVLVEFATPEETVQAVRDGESDAVFADYDYLAPFVAASNGEFVIVGDRVPLGEGIAAAFRTSDDALREQFDAAITAMKADGTLNELLAKWFADGVEVPQY